MNRQELAKQIYDIAHLTGFFKLRSGKTSNVYFDKYQFESQPQILSVIAEHMIELLPKKIDYLGAMEMGGIPIATAISLKTDIPVIFLRKEPKAYGTCKFAEGPNIKGKRLCLIEDVVSTGGQAIITTEMIRKEGAFVDDVLCVIDRSEGKTEKMEAAHLRLRAILTMAEILDTAK
ncbi:MAG: orotate phosphoribosyltransferase [Bdellovibrionaceae bacterium]|nr:orotate phosphoribosyltransferase [Pseudobdellovibrionaceae bacterium]